MTGNALVDEIGTIAFEGNVIPWTWYNVLRFPNGKPDLNAIILLSDIVYWYRPSPIHDEATGQLVGFKKRFAADLLQRSSQSYAQQFGLTKRQVSEALSRLQKSYHVIRLVFRTVDTPQGRLANVLFIEPCVEEIRTITHQRDTSHVQTGYPSRSNGIPLTFQRETSRAPEEARVKDLSGVLCTEITTEIVRPPIFPQPEILNTNMSSPEPDAPPNDIEQKPPLKRKRQKQSSADALAVLTHLNTTQGRSYRNATQIDALLGTGVSIDECRLVIDFGYAILRNERSDWYMQYFDNVTPFRPANFDKYLQRANEWSRNNREPSTPTNRRSATYGLTDKEYNTVANAAELAQELLNDQGRYPTIPEISR